MSRTIALLVLAPVLMYAFACLMLYATQRHLVFFQVPRLDKSLPTVSLRTEVGDVLVSTRAHAGPRAVVYFGGNAEDVSLTVSDLALAFPDRAVFALHYRGYGGSAGSPGERELVADGLALFDLVHVTQADITVIGRSLGSGVAMQVAAARPATQLVLVTPYDSLADVGAVHYPIFPVRWLSRDPFDSVAVAPEVTMPVTIIAAADDRIVPMRNTRRLEAAFRPQQSRFVVLPHAGHNFDLTPEYLHALQQLP
ncbi:MAG: alpha/beta hydrolase [Arenimonas sp.]